MPQMRSIGTSRPPHQLVGLLAAIAAIAALLYATCDFLRRGSEMADPTDSQEQPTRGTPTQIEHIDETTLIPGLVAHYRAAGPHGAMAHVARIDAKPAFTWGASSPHPRLPPGPFEVEWSGQFVIHEVESLRFAAHVDGEVCVWLDGQCVLNGHGAADQSWIESSHEYEPLHRVNRLRIRYRSLDGPSRRIQIWWSGASFSFEPLPARRLRHAPTDRDVNVQKEEVIDHGRDAVVRHGCACCHTTLFPGLSCTPPGPLLEGLSERMSAAWLTAWLDDPTRHRPGARMPQLFSDDEKGRHERELVAAYLLFRNGSSAKPANAPPGDHRAGKQAFLGMGCIACHDDPGATTASRDPDQIAFFQLADRFSVSALAAFLEKPTRRYPDGRMPQFPISADTGRNLASYLLMASKQTSTFDQTSAIASASAERIGAGKALVQQKQCGRCHEGLDDARPDGLARDARGRVTNVNPGCLSGNTLPRFRLDDGARTAIDEYIKVAADEVYPSPFAERQQLLRRSRCHLCHQRDADTSSVLEEKARTTWAPFLYRLPYQRTPCLTEAGLKYTRDYLVMAIRDGAAGLRPDWYSFHMPGFGAHAESIVAALFESDGETMDHLAAATPAHDPTAAAIGPVLVGFEGYACVNCHLWNGKSFGAVEPGAVGPDLVAVPRRLRRAWFDRFLDNPSRVNPGTPMPAIFRRGEPAPVTGLLGGDAARHKGTLWHYFGLGGDAPTPAPKPPMEMPRPRAGEAAIVAQIPLRLDATTLVESICMLNGSGDALVYDVDECRLRACYASARLLRHSNTWRTFELAGQSTGLRFPGTDWLIKQQPGGETLPARIAFEGYDRLDDGIRIRSRVDFHGETRTLVDTFRVETSQRTFTRQIELLSLADADAFVLRLPHHSARTTTADDASTRTIRCGRMTSLPRPGEVVVCLDQPRDRQIVANFTYKLPPSTKIEASTAPRSPPQSDKQEIELLERPGYQAVHLPRPKTASGEDVVMPIAMTVDPKTGTPYVASVKQGEIFAVQNAVDAAHARFTSYLGGMFQDVLAMHHDGQSLFVLHRRNLTRVRDDNNDGVADRFDRVARLTHAVGDSYDWAYGLVREPGGAFLLTLAPHSGRDLRGAGSLLRVRSGVDSAQAEEIAFGFRNPLGWSSGPEGEVFFTDNQGEWVATNKLCHVVAGRYYGFPRHDRPDRSQLPAGKTSVWIPYEWAKSINGIAFDATNGRFGPFAGQFFLAELMHGGAIIRAQVEKVNGVYQGACFPFWGKGLLGPLVLAFDPRGPLYVGGITQPGWMGQPDRGALFRVEFTGKVPFEIRSIHVRQNGFQMVLTRPVDREACTKPAAFTIDHHRYEYTGAYGSPELDRTRVAIREVYVSPDGTTIDLVTEPLVKDRVYRIHAPGVRSVEGETLVNATGAYTLHEIP